MRYKDYYENVNSHSVNYSEDFEKELKCLALSPVILKGFPGYDSHLTFLSDSIMYHSQYIRAHWRRFSFKTEIFSSQIKSSTKIIPIELRTDQNHEFSENDQSGQT